MFGKRAGVIRVLVASPRDLEVERDVIRAAVEELNLGLAPSLDLRLELVRWETHTTPSLGNDPQDIINRELRDDYEVFIGILWTRFGTPTPRAGSGTIEEFQRAKARWLADPESVSVMFYFKEEPIPVDIDAEQLAKVQAFRKELDSTSLYGTFVAAEDLGRLLRIHLTRHLVRNANPHPGSEASLGSGDLVALVPAGDQRVVQRSQPIGAAGPTDDEGILDLVERTSEAFAGVGEVLSSMTGGLTALTDGIREAASGIQEAKTQDGQVDYTEAKRVVNSLADKVNSIAARFEVDVPAFREKFAEAMDAVIKGAEVSAEFGAEGIDAIRVSRSSVASLATQSESALEVVDGLRTSIDELPRVTTQFNRARKRLSAILGAVHREFSSANTLVREAIAVVDQTLKRFDANGEGGS